jgi:serine/threonine protein kinase
MIGSTLGNYKILEKLGEGGQGTVYKAIDSKLGRTLVIKVLPAELTSKEANLKRFEREARLASALDHPNICTIFDLNEIDDVHFIVMQYIEGRNVRQLVNGRPLSLESALSIALQTAEALAAAHSRGIIHRDIKAGNVMVTPTGQVKVLDFGLAKLLDEDAARTSGIHHTEITEVGVPYGTATYAAPIFFLRACCFTRCSPARGRSGAKRRWKFVTRFCTTSQSRFRRCDRVACPHDCKASSIKRSLKIHATGTSGSRILPTISDLSFENSAVIRCPASTKQQRRLRQNI